jgi:hypothetical protein
MGEEIPMLLFGADPLFNIEWKLFIKDILHVHMHSQVNGKWGETVYYRSL